MTGPASATPTDARAGASRGTGRALLVVLGGIVAALHIWKLSPALGPLSEQLHLSLGQAGVLVAVIQAAGICLGMTVGLFNDTIGLRRGCLWGFGCLTVGSAVGALAPGAGMLLASRVLEGLGFLLVSVASPALIRRLVPPDRLAPVVGLWGCFIPIAAAVSQASGGLLLESVGWRAWWMGAAALSLIVGIALTLVLPRDPARPHAGVDAPRPVTARALAVLCSGPVWATALVMACYTAQWNGVVQFLPTVYAEAGVAAGAAGALSALAAVSNALGNVGAGQAMGRGVRPVTLWTIGLVAMGVCAAVAFGVAPLVAPEWRFAVRYGAVIAFSALGGLIPTTAIAQFMALAPTQDTVSTSLGLGQQFNALGQFAGPVAVALTVQAAGGWHATWWVTVALAGVGLLATGWAHAHARGSAIPQHAGV